MIRPQDRRYAARNDDADPDRVRALAAQLGRLRRMEAENEVYREMLAAADARHNGRDPQDPAVAHLTALSS